MTTDTVKNAQMTTESVVNFVFFETPTTEKSATVVHNKRAMALYTCIDKGYEK